MLSLAFVFLRIKKVLILTLLVAPIFVIGATFDLEGQAWSSTIGWIDFSPDTRGVQISSDGQVTGYGWSENVGWIKFHNLEGYPGEPHHSVEIDVNGEKENCKKDHFCGWARAIAGEEKDDGWDGWIHFGSDDSLYQITLEESPGDRAYQLVGAGWGSSVIGWLSFSCINENVCGTFPYRVETDFYPYQPSFDILEIKSGDYCNKTDPIETAYFDYSNEQDLDPEKLEMEIINTETNITVFQDSNLDYSDSYILPEDKLSFDTEYKIKARVIDENGVVSDWKEKSFLTKIKHPKVDFTWEPSEPKANQRVDFKDQTTYYDWKNATKRDGKITLRWLFPEVAQNELKEGPREEFSEVKNEFSEEGEHEITLEVEANVKGKENYSEEICSQTKTINAGFEVPEWKETDPF